MTTLPAPAHPVPPEGVGAGSAEVSPLALVAYVLGIAAVVLGVTAVWYFAAIPIGLAAFVVGIVALRRPAPAGDRRARTRATIGAVLGLVAIILGLCAWYFLPRVVDDVSDFFTDAQNNVNHNVDTVNRGLTADVRSLDRTVTADLKRLETQNREDLAQLEKRSNDSLAQLEARVNAVVDTARGSAKQDLAALEASLREDIRSVEAAFRAADDSFTVQATLFEARIARIEKLLGIT
ncbi:MAG: hypothetical protein U0W40_20515 [Acidimicrobiia bacterium]